jgi:hypothetical protein
MKKINLINLSIFIFLNNFVFLNLNAQIYNVIVTKVGESLVTSIDIENEILTNLMLNKQEVTQENINNNKKYAIKNLINKKIKSNEINKYGIKDYSQKDLQNYIDSIAKKFNTNQNGLKKIFIQNNINFQSFEENYKVELLWNTLNFQLYKNQTNVNIVDVENEVEKIKEGKSEEELKKIRANILNIKKQEKLNLFSRSHFSNLESTIPITFNE